MEQDMGVSSDFCWPTPRFFEPHDLAVVDSLIDWFSMHVPNEDSLSGLYSCYGGDSSPPDGANSCSAATATTMAATTASKNIIIERDRRKRLNEKLYALRGVVPNITKMDKASIIWDAIAYVEQLQEQERQMLDDISALESAAANVSVAGAEEDGFPQRKKMRRAPSAPSIDNAALYTTISPPVEILEVQVLEVGEKVVEVSVRYGRARDAMAKVCRTLESLHLKIIAASITSTAVSILHTMFVKTEGMGAAQMKETIHAALAQLHVTRSSLKPMSY